MGSITKLRRTWSIVLVSAILLLCTGLFADNDSGEEVSESGDTARPAGILLPDSTINLINTQYQTIEPIFRKSCFDCHSAHTNFPWYHSLPVVGSIMDGHIKEGRRHVDFTDGFPFRTPHSQIDILGDIRKEIEDGDMPILSYRLMHWGSLIEGAQRDSVFNWIDQTLTLMRSAAESKN